jgi:preprotein translocase subunit YajC
MFASPAYAQTATGSAPSGLEGLFASPLPLMLFLGIIFWFFLLRPEAKARKEHRAKIDAVKKGDSVVTGGGIVGKVTKVEGDKVEVEIASGVKIKALIAMLADINPLVPAKPAND